MVWLETERLLFRDHEESDLEADCEMESDPEYRWPQIVHPRSELVRGFFGAEMQQAPLRLRATVFKPDGLYIGRCGLYPFRNEEGETVPQEAVLAYYLARPYWGRGLATEAGAAFVRHGFENLGMTRIHAGVNLLNVRSIRVLEKLGFQPIAEGESNGTRWRDYAIEA
jgi:RimJ/RimL family protein N-acetyltransferase